MDFNLGKEISEQIFDNRPLIMIELILFVDPVFDKKLEHIGAGGSLDAVDELLVIGTVTSLIGRNIRSIDLLQDPVDHIRTIEIPNKAYELISDNRSVIVFDIDIISFKIILVIIGKEAVISLKALSQEVPPFGIGMWNTQVIDCLFRQRCSYTLRPGRSKAVVRLGILIKNESFYAYGDSNHKNYQD